MTTTVHMGATISRGQWGNHGQSRTLSATRIPTRSPLADDLYGPYYRKFESVTHFRVLAKAGLSFTLVWWSSALQTKPTTVVAIKIGTGLLSMLMET